MSVSVNAHPTHWPATSHIVHAGLVEDCVTCSGTPRYVCRRCGETFAVDDGDFLWSHGDRPFCSEACAAAAVKGTGR